MKMYKYVGGGSNLGLHRGTYDTHGAFVPDTEKQKDSVGNIMDVPILKHFALQTHYNKYTKLQERFKVILPVNDIEEEYIEHSNLFDNEQNQKNGTVMIYLFEGDTVEGNVINPLGFSDSDVELLDQAIKIDPDAKQKLLDNFRQGVQYIIHPEPKDQELSKPPENPSV